MLIPASQLWRITLIELEVAARVLRDVRQAYYSLLKTFMDKMIKWSERQINKQWK